MSKILFVVLTLVSFNIQAQSVYYVSTTGNNNNSGLSEANAWRTISYAASLVNLVGTEISYI